MDLRVCICPRWRITSRWQTREFSRRGLQRYPSEGQCGFTFYKIRDLCFSLSLSLFGDAFETTCRCTWRVIIIFFAPSDRNGDRRLIQPFPLSASKLRAGRRFNRPTRSKCSFTRIFGTWFTWLDARSARNVIFLLIYILVVLVLTRDRLLWNRR